jgi:hypothetical protein
MRGRYSFSPGSAEALVRPDRNADEDVPAPSAGEKVAYGVTKWLTGSRLNLALVGIRGLRGRAGNFGIARGVAWN